MCTHISYKKRSLQRRTAKKSDMSAAAVIYLLALFVLNDCGTGVGPMRSLAERTSPSFRPSYRRNHGQGSAEDEPKFILTDAPDKVGVNITVTAPSILLNELQFVEVSSKAVKSFCMPLSPEDSADPAGGNDSLLAERTAVMEHLELDDYCARLTNSCNWREPRVKRPPTRCRDHPFTVGVNGAIWARDTKVSEARQKDTATGPAVSVEVVQFGHRFPKLVISHMGCVDPSEYHRREIAAGQSHLLNSDCTLAYNKTIELLVRPSTRFCNETDNCLHHRVYLPAMYRLSPPPPGTVLLAGPPALLTAGVPLLAVALLAAAAGGLLWFRRSHRSALDSLPAAAAAARENLGFDRELASVADRGAVAGLRVGPSVLLLHLARSDAERAAVRQIAAELRARGAAVIDSGTPEWRRAARRDATALVSAVPAGGRVLLLSSPAVVAAVAAGGGPGEPERLLAAAVRQLAGSRLTTDYGRLYQARLTADAPAVADLVPGAVYTLPEHQHELVTALLASTNSDTVNGTISNGTVSNGGTCITITNTNIDINSDIHIDTTTGAVTNNGTNSDASTDTNSDAKTGTNSDANTGTNRADVNTSQEINTDTTTSANPNPNTNTNSNAST